MSRNLLLGVWISVAVVIEVANGQDQQQPPLRFIEEPLEQYNVREDGYVNLPCKFNGDANGCIWMRGGSPIFFGQGSLYQYVGDKSRGDCTMRIGRITRIDENQWSCQLPTLTTTLSSKIVRISVVVPPTPPFIVFQNRTLPNSTVIDVTRTQPFQFYCISPNGKPASTMEWIVNRYRIENAQKKNQTSESNPNLQDSILIWKGQEWPKPGKFEAKCIAHHPGYINSPATIITLIVKQPTRAVEVQVNGQYVSEFALSDNQDSAVLTCVGDGYPMPQYEWLFRETESAEWIPIAQGNSTNVDKGRGGLYMCRAMDIGGAIGNAGPTSLPMTIKTAEVESSNAGLVIGVVIACAVVLTALVMMLIFLYRRKACLFAPRDSKAQPEE